MKHVCLLFLILISTTARTQVYMHDFGNSPISAHPYTTAPAIFQSNLSASSWTNSTGTWTSYAGNTGEALGMANSGGAASVSLSFNIASGYKLNISSFNFWCQRSATGAQNWSMLINGIAVGSGAIPTTSAAIGTTNVLNPVNNLSGTVTVLILLSGASGSGTFRLDDFTLNGSIVPNAYKLLDNFNRNDSIRPGIPSSGGPAWWVEIEPGIFCSVLGTIRIKSNQLELSGCDLSNTTCVFSPTQTTSMNMTGKYPTVFSTAAGTMEWYFNMQQSRADPTGFASGQYGAAFVIGSNTNDPTAPSKYGYAVIFGESGTADPIRLVSFNGSSFNSTTFTNIITVASPAVKTDYMSIKVTYNPCDNEWSLTVRDDGAAFADPSTITGTGGTAINSTFTSSDLLWLGQVWNHAGSCALAKFDNFYIPNAGTNTGTYVWNGSTSSDFQCAYNWTPVRQCIKTTDKLVFNSSSPASSILTNIPSQTIGQLTVTNNRTLTLMDIAGDAVPSTLTIGGSTGTDLQVDAGSSIIMDVSSGAAGDAMVIDVGPGATGSISGTVSFNATPGGTRPHRLLAEDAGGITFNNGGLVKAMALTGNAFGSSLPVNTILFNTGSAYECYSGANPFGLAQPQSKVVFNTGSTYRHFSANQPSLLGRVYADVEFNASMNITFGGAAALTVNNFRILSGTTEFTGSSNSLPINTNIKGDLVLSPGATFNYDPVSASAFIFNSATVAQKINNAGTLTLGKQLTVRLNSSFVTAPQLTVETDIKIGGVLDIVQGTLKLNGNIHILSDTVSTASVAPITGTISYGTGRFVIERYIPAHAKAWQFLAVPTTTGQTINAAWQEGNAPLVAGTPGLGTIITSNVAGPGFDIIGGGGPSMKTYVPATDTWQGISGTNIAHYNQKGYMLFVRGDRTVTTSSTPATTTNLRSTGKIFDPVSNIPPVTNIGADKFESIGNPYASAIDFSNDLGVVKSANVQRVFYIWDPKLGGNNNFGGYQTCIKGSGNDYTILPGGGSYDAAGSVQNLIQSGQAFFVHTFGGSGTVSFTENAKVTGSRLVTRPPFTGAGNNRKLRTNLYAVNGNSTVLLDAVLNEFSAAYSSNIDIMDAVKPENLNESLGLLRGNEILVAERRANIIVDDTVFYDLQKLRVQEYELEFVPASMAMPGLSAFLEDGYLHTSTAVSLSANSRIRFTVLSDRASYDPARFRLVFRRQLVPAQGGHAETEIANHLQVYPNPVTGNSFEVIVKGKPAGNYQLQLINQSGNVLLQQPMLVTGNNFKKKIMFSRLLPGTYKMVLQSADGHQLNGQVIIH